MPYIEKGMAMCDVHHTLPVNIVSWSVTSILLCGNNAAQYLDRHYISQQRTHWYRLQVCTDYQTLGGIANNTDIAIYGRGHSASTL